MIGTASKKAGTGTSDRRECLAPRLLGSLGHQMMVLGKKGKCKPGIIISGATANKHLGNAAWYGSAEGSMLYVVCCRCCIQSREGYACFEMDKRHASKYSD